MNFLSPSQFGFRQNYSTYMALSELYDYVSSAVDRNEYCAGIFIDLSKAFDTIDHSILLSKLEYYGIRGITLCWFRSYLECRKQFVSYNDSMAELKSITVGVLQGSMLGPLLFSIYINDIVDCSQVLKNIPFADDMNMLYSSKDYSSLMCTINNELDKVADWFEANK